MAVVKDNKETKKSTKKVASTPEEEIIKLLKTQNNQLKKMNENLVVISKLLQ